MTWKLTFSSAKKHKFQSSLQKGEAEYRPQNNTPLKKKRKKNKVKATRQEKNIALFTMGSMKNTSNNSKESLKQSKKKFSS